MRSVSRFLLLGLALGHILPTASAQSEQKIVFDLGCKLSDLYVMDSSGSNARRVTREAESGRDAAQPVWVPGGRQIAFTLITITNGRHRSDVYVVNPDGTGLRSLTQTAGQASSWHPTWSPDGSKVAFQSDRDGKTELYTMNADGSGLRRLTDTPGTGRYAGQPAWSPDGQQIAFDSNHSGREEIYLFDVKTSHVRALTETPNGKESWNADWSPDGRSIVFGSNRDGDDEIYTTHADGSNVRRLNIKAYRPRWSPDGKRLIYMSETGETRLQIFTAAPDGSDISRLTNSKCASRHPDWCCRPLAASSPHP